MIFGLHVCLLRITCDAQAAYVYRDLFLMPRICLVQYTVRVGAAINNLHTF